MTAKQMWKAFLKITPSVSKQKFEAWCYGGTEPDKLAELTFNGIKTATSSAYPMYAAVGAALPCAGRKCLRGSSGV